MSCFVLIDSFTTDIISLTRARYKLIPLMCTLLAIVERTRTIFHPNKKQRNIYCLANKGIHLTWIICKCTGNIKMVVKMQLRQEGITFKKRLLLKVWAIIICAWFVKVIAHNTSVGHYPCILSKVNMQTNIELEYSYYS